VSRLKALGTDSVGTLPAAVKRPEVASTEKPATLLWPRFGAYKNFPDGVIWIWEQVFLPSNPSGKVVVVWKGDRVPVEVSRL
jgi:hypothetical protein